MTGRDVTWHKPAEVAPRLRLTVREVRDLCASDLIDHRRLESPGGRVRYLISDSAVTAYENRTTRRAKSSRGAA